MIIIYYSNLFSNFKHCFIWLRGCLKMKFTMNESKNLKSQWMKLCKRSRSKSRQIWVIDRDRDQESWINRDRDRDHKSAFDRDRDRDSSKLPIPVPVIPVDYWFFCGTSWFLELCTRDRPFSYFKNTTFCSPDPWQPHFSTWQVYIISTTPLTTPFLTVTSWFLELFTRDRPISHFKNTIFCSPDPWQTHFSP